MEYSTYAWYSDGLWRKECYEALTLAPVTSLRYYTVASPPIYICIYVETKIYEVLSLDWCTMYYDITKCRNNDSLPFYEPLCGAPFAGAEADWGWQAASVHLARDKSLEIEGEEKNIGENARFRCGRGWFLKCHSFYAPEWRDGGGSALLDRML